MKGTRLAALLCVALTATGVTTLAADYRYKVFIGATYVSPLEDSDDTFDEVTDTLEASNEVGYELGFEYRATRLLGVEASYLNATHEVDFAGERIADIDLEPVSVTLNFHLVDASRVDFWIGPTVALVEWSDLEVDGGLTVDTDRDFAYGATAGVDVVLGESFALTGALRYLDVTLESGYADLDVSPLFTRVGLAYRF